MSTLDWSKDQNKQLLMPLVSSLENREKLPAIESSEHDPRLLAHGDSEQQSQRQSRAVPRICEVACSSSLVGQKTLSSGIASSFSGVDDEADESFDQDDAIQDGVSENPSAQSREPEASSSVTPTSFSEVADETDQPSDQNKVIQVAAQEVLASSSSSVSLGDEEIEASTSDHRKKKDSCCYCCGRVFVRIKDTGIWLISGLTSFAWSRLPSLSFTEQRALVDPQEKEHETQRRIPSKKEGLKPKKSPSSSTDISKHLTSGYDFSKKGAVPLEGHDFSSIRSQIVILKELMRMLDQRIGTQKDWLKQFNLLDRYWQGKAMFWVWKTHGKSNDEHFGRAVLKKSMLSLVKRVGNESEDRRVIDFVLDEMLTKLHQADAVVPRKVSPKKERTHDLSSHQQRIELLEEAITTAKPDLEEQDHRSVVPSRPAKKSLSRVTSIQRDASKYTNPLLEPLVTRVVDAVIVEYLSNPWKFLMETYFPGQTFKSEAELNQAARDFLKAKGFTALNFKVIEHPDLSGWVLKGNTSQVSYIRNAAGRTGNNRYDHLNRVRMSQILRQATEEENLLFDFPEVFLIDSGTGSEDVEKRYIVIQQKLPIIRKEKVFEAFRSMPYDQQHLYAEHLCRLIVKTGYCDPHFDNITLINGKLYIFDEEAMGVLVDESDRAPYYDKTFDECVAIGLQRVIDMIGQDLPIFRVVAENALTELREKWIDTTSHRLAFRRFIALMQDPLVTNGARIREFRQLDHQLQKFLGSVVSMGFHLSGDKEGSERILQQPEVLTFLSSRSGIDILRQIDVRFQIQGAIETLVLLKELLKQENPSQKRFLELGKQLEQLFQGNGVFNPLKEKLNSLKAAIEKEMEGASDQEMFKELCFRLLYVKTPGSKQCLLDDLIGMLRTVKRDFSLDSMQWRLTRAFDPKFGAYVEPTPARAVKKDLVKADRIPQQIATQKLHILMVAYECAVYGLKFGGLGEAVYGMARGFAKEGHQVTILTPKFDKLPKTITDQLAEKEVVEHPFTGRVKKDRVLGFEKDGVSLRYLEDTPSGDQAIDHYSVPDPKQIYVDGVLVDPREPWYGLKERMAYFSSSVAEYIAKHKDDTDVAVCHDWHSAYAINRIAHRYFKPWSEGRMPAFVFVIHNNNYGCQGIYSDKSVEILSKFDDQRAGMNVMLDAMALSDQVVTVSPSFAIEIQQPILGAGIDPWMRQIAHRDKLSGIANGSNPDIWNPAENEVLKNWVDPVTKQPLPLNYSADDPDILAKKALIKEQLQKALEVYYPEAVSKHRLNLRDRDLILYVGRYDSSQKGLERFSPMMQAAHERDAVFITMGIGEDPTASQILDALEEEGDKLGNVWITRGKADNFSVKMQMGDKEKGIPGLGPLFRAAATYGIAPSNFEPCGLVQFESWLFGTLVIATATGGLADTVTPGPEHPDFNGFTFERLADWNSKKQDELAFDATLRALDHWRALPKAKQNVLMQRVMKDAQLCSWTTAPGGLTPIQQYEKVLGMAKGPAKRNRGKIGSIDLIGLDEPKAVTRDHFFGPGSQVTLYETFGAHIVREDDGITGVRFRLMAPGAKSINLIIQDKIEEQIYPMKDLGNGVWELFVEEATIGTIYEYEITDALDKTVRKVDPFAFGAELRPKHRSVVADKDAFRWSDGAWLKMRQETAGQEQPINIYEIHVGSWRRKKGDQFMNYREIADELAIYCRSMNYTHVELLGLLEHPADSSWGYQVSNYFAPTSRCGSLEDFQYLVNKLHEAGIGVIVDFVPFHFAPDEWGLREFAGQRFFESSDLYNGESPGWGTRIFDMEREDVRNFLLSSANFFLQNHVDGLRVDAVSPLVLNITRRRRWMPNKEGSHWNLGGIQFLRDFNAMVHSQFPGAITIAENSLSIQQTKIDTDPPEMDGLGFDLRWNLEWMQRSLRILKSDPKRRNREFNELVGVFDYHWQMKNVSSISHDEVVHGKGSIYSRARGTPSEKLAEVRLHQALKAFFPADAILSFMGTEFAQKREWRFQGMLDWDLLKDAGHHGVWKLTQAINKFYLENKPLWKAGIMLSRFEWIDIHPQNYVMSYHRRDDQGNQIAIIHNFSKKSFAKYFLRFRHPENVVRLKQMKVVFNTDRREFGGSGQFDAVPEARIIADRQEGLGGRGEEEIDDVEVDVGQEARRIVQAQDQVGKPKGFELALPASSTVVLQEEFA